MSEIEVKAGLIDHATLTELQGPVFDDWATYCGRTKPPSQKLVTNWAWQRDKTHFPDPVGECWIGDAGLRGGARTARTYDVCEVLCWYLDRPVNGRAA